MSLNLRDSEPSQPEDKLPLGLGILLGLLLTLGLHLLQILLFVVIPLKGKGEAIPFFFGFIQLFYMLPAIIYFQRRDNRGMMIGLIIGTALTFTLGVPAAVLGILCATNPYPP